MVVRRQTHSEPPVLELLLILKLFPCTTSFPEDMVKIVAFSYNKDGKYISEECEPSLGFCKATLSLFASPKADIKKKKKSFSGMMVNFSWSFLELFHKSLRT